MRNKSKLASYIAITAFLTLGFSISLQSLLAEWTAPNANPPAENVLPPVYNEFPDEPENFVLIGKPTGVNGNFSVSGAISVTTKNNYFLNLYPASDNAPGWQNAIRFNGRDGTAKAYIYSDNRYDNESNIYLQATKLNLVGNVCIGGECHSSWSSVSGIITGGCGMWGAKWGTALSCPLAANMTCAAGNTARIVNWCSTGGECWWNAVNSYPIGFCISN